jgi:hypothetical protein
MSTLRYVGSNGSSDEEPAVVTYEFLNDRADSLGVTENDVRVVTNEVSAGLAVTTPEANAFFFDKVVKSTLSGRLSPTLTPAAERGVPSGIATITGGVLTPAQAISNPPTLNPKNYLAPETYSAVTTSLHQININNRIGTISVAAPGHSWFPMIFARFRVKQETGNVIPCISIVDELGMVFAYGEASVRQGFYTILSVTPITTSKNFGPAEGKLFSIHLHCKPNVGAGTVSNVVANAYASCMVAPI